MTLTHPRASAPTAARQNAAVTKESVDAALRRIDGVVTGEMEHFGTPGVAVAVIHDDRVVFSKGYGVRKVGTSDPVTPDTVFQLASLSKPIGATAIAKLVETKVISWDAPIHRYAPTLRFSDPWVTEHVTFADLYAHRSGLPGNFGNTLEHIGFDRAQILARLHTVPLKGFRDEFSYSNFGMTAAADVAARAGGTTFEDMIRKVLFEPAGMHRSSARFADFAAQPNRATLHIKLGDAWTVGPTRQADAQAPAGGISSSLVDVSRWARLVLGGGRLDGVQLICEDALGKTHVPHVVKGALASYDAYAETNGLGWNVTTDHLGFLRWSHSGAFSSGASTTVVLLPRQGLGVVALTNGMPQGVPEIIADEIVDRIATAGTTRDWRTLWYDERFARLFGPSGPGTPAEPTAMLDRRAYLGTFSNDYYGDVEVVASGDGLALVEGPRRATLPLTHVGGNTFTVVNYPETPQDRTEVTFTVVGDRATALDIGDNDGPGTGTLTRNLRGRTGSPERKQR